MRIQHDEIKARYGDLNIVVSDFPIRQSDKRRHQKQYPHLYHFIMENCSGKTSHSKYPIIHGEVIEYRIEGRKRYLNGGLQWMNLGTVVVPEIL